MRISTPATAQVLAVVSVAFTRWLLGKIPYYPTGHTSKLIPSRSALLRHAGLAAAAPPLRPETDLFCHG